MQPSLGSGIVSGVSISTSNKNTYLLVDITPAMAEWLNGVNPNYGIALVPGPSVSFAINSKENSASSHAPELDLVLNSGTPGPQGPQGPQGLQGSPGPQGATGSVGPLGPQGNPGVPGPAGQQGPQGTAGTQGLPGLNGATGSQGPIGPAGLTARGPWVAGTTAYAPNDVVTDAGSTWRCKATPACTPGAEPSAATNIDWELLASKGNDGAQGSQGLQGPPGAQGMTGSQGAAGPAGAQGVTGSQGPMGAPGAQGLTGLTGAMGLTGPSGPAGPAGPPGAGATPGRIALLQWWSSLTYLVGLAPSAVAFDGTNIWVANRYSNSVSKLLASTGETVGTYTVGTAPIAVKRCVPA